MGQTDKPLSPLINLSATSGEASRPVPPEVMQEDAHSIVYEVVSLKQLDLKTNF